MNPKRVIILGAGISGLSLAWYMNKTLPSAEVIILEKDTRAGGWIHTDHTTGFLFEKGPRAFKASKSPATLQLIRELNMQDQLIWSEEKKHHRYLWHAGALHQLPRGLFAFLVSPLMQGVWSKLITEWKRPVQLGDETVWDFAVRRFNPEIARRFFDPMVVGIFGGNARTVSIKSCFPKLKQWEEQYGSITKGLWHAIREKREKYSTDIPGLPLSALYSFQNGIETLIHALIKQISAKVRYNTEARSIARQGNLWTISTSQESLSGDFLFCALPLRETVRLFQPLAPELMQTLAQVQSRGIAVVNVGYANPVLPVEGFGYLTQTHMQEDILGVVFDSSVFHEHNRRDSETRLTIKLEDRELSNQQVIELALKGIGKHLRISSLPDVVVCKHAIDAIPQYGIDHLERMVQFQDAFRRQVPQCSLVGNYLSGIAVDQCIAHAKRVAERVN